MGKNRLEAFSDGVLAIIITIMVLELKVPHETELNALRPIVPVFLSYCAGLRDTRPDREYRQSLQDHDRVVRKWRDLVGREG